MTQSDRVLEYMKQYGSITALDALEDLGCMHLASRITDIKQAGYAIKKEVVECKNRWGEKVRFVKYSLEE